MSSGREPPADVRDSRPSRRRRWGCLAIFVVLAAGLHVPLLRALDRWLVVDDPWPTADYVLVCSGDGRYDVAMAMLGDGRARRVLLVESAPPRTVRYGIEPPATAVGQRRLIQLGVSEAAIDVEDAGDRDEREFAAWLAGWLHQHDQPRVTILCERNESASYQRLFDRLLPPELAACLKIDSLDSRAFDPNWWWLQPAGVRSFLAAWLCWGQDAFVGYDQQEPYEWDFEAYVESLR